MAHFGRVGIVLSPRLNNNGCHDWHNAHPRQSLNCKLVQRSRELLNWSRCVSWFIAPADQILQWTWKKKLSRIGSSFRALRKPDPPFTNSYASSICWRKQPRRSTCKFMVKKFTDAEKFVGSRRQCSTYFKWVSSRLVTSSRSLIEIVLGAQSRKAFGDFGERSKPRRTEKGGKN